MITLLGNAVENVEYTGSPISVTNPRRYWAAGEFRLLTPVHTGSETIMRWGPENWGIGVTAQPVGNVTAFRTGCRFTKNGNSETFSAAWTTMTVMQWYKWLGLLDFDLGVVKFFVGDLLISQLLKESDDTWAWNINLNAAIVPRIRGSLTAGKNFEVRNFVGNVGGILTDEEAANWNFDKASGLLLSSPPTFGVKPVGALNSYADTLVDIYGSSNMSQIKGPVYPAEGFPFFSGESLILTNVAATSTARKVIVSGNSTVSAGNIHVIIDDSSVITSEPENVDIKAGRIDGETDALESATVNMTDQTSFSVELSVPADKNYLVYVTHDTDGSGNFSNKASVSIATKRPVISPPSDKFWCAANNEPLENETGMTVQYPLGAEGTVPDLTVETDSEARGEVNLTSILNSPGVDLDIGDEISLQVIRTNGEELTIRNATIVAGTD